MIKNYISEIEKGYTALREKENYSLSKRKEEIEKKLPQVIEIDKKIWQLSVKLSLGSIKQIPNREAFLTDIKNQITELRAKKYELLVANGYPQNYLELHYNCSKCKDTGYIGSDRCSCFKQKIVELYYNSSDLKSMLKTNNFDNFNFEVYSARRTGSEPETPRKNIEKIVSSIWKFIENFETSAENLLFYGSSGTGKTFLSNCIAKELLDKGILVVYRTADELIRNLKEIKLENNTEVEDLLINCDLLIVDDLGTEQINVFSKTELFNLLNKKLLRNKKMIISTNYTIEKLSQTYSERMTSRLFGNFTLYKFYGEDIRIKLNLAKTKPSFD